jgi:hypothetical protein
MVIQTVFIVFSFALTFFFFPRSITTLLVQPYKTPGLPGDAAVRQVVVWLQ